MSLVVHPVDDGRGLTLGQAVQHQTGVVGEEHLRRGSLKEGGAEGGVAEGRGEED